VSLSDTDCEQRLLWLRLIFLVFLLLAKEKFYKGGLD